MHKEYKLMKSHNYKNLDDYYHCKAHYSATKQGKIGEVASVVAGNEKEAFDYFKNRLYKGITAKEARKDYWHDLNVNQIGRDRANEMTQSNAIEACADFREKNKSLPRKYW